MDAWPMNRALAAQTFSKASEDMTSKSAERDSEDINLKMQLLSKEAAKGSSVSGARPFTYQPISGLDKRGKLFDRSDRHDTFGWFVKIKRHDSFELRFGGELQPLYFKSIVSLKTTIFYVV